MQPNQTLPWPNVEAAVRGYFLKAFKVSQEKFFKT